MKRFTPALVVLAAFGIPAAYAQSYPTKPVRLVVGFTPGGGVDINARAARAGARRSSTASSSSSTTGPARGTNIANEFVAKAPPDGYTLLMNTAAIAINMTLYKQVNFDAIKDFAPISRLFARARTSSSCIPRCR